MLLQIYPTNNSRINFSGGPGISGKVTVKMAKSLLDFKNPFSYYFRLTTSLYWKVTLFKITEPR